MGLIELVVILLVVGVLLWLLDRAPFIDGNIKQVIRWVVIVVVVLWLVLYFLGDVRVPTLRR